LTSSNAPQNIGTATAAKFKSRGAQARRPRTELVCASRGCDFRRRWCAGPSFAGRMFSGDIYERA
jgi:hypothetical protein